MDTGDRTILRRLIVALALIILLGAVIWVFFVRNADKKQTQRGGNADTSQGTGGNTNPATTNQPVTGNSQAQGNPPAPAPTSPIQVQQPSTLTNAGPGNLTILFVGSTILGAVGHHSYKRYIRRALRP